ncbi:MAG: LysR family transcriptional regulator [Pseudomonadota bacterium]
MRLTLRQLQLFCAVARTGSTTAAAESVALSQSATSAALNELETALGSRLFDRVGKRLVLNDTGRTLLPEALGLLDRAQGIEDGFAGGTGPARVQIRLAASTTIGNYLLPALLAAYRAELPLCRLDVVIGNTQNVGEAVADFQADLGLIEGTCHVEGMAVLPWRQDELVIVASPSHPLAREAAVRPLEPAALRRGPWLLREPGSGTREAVEQALVPALDHVEADITLGSSEAIKYAVADGLGITCLSRVLVQDLLSAGRLVVLPTVLPPMTRPLFVIHRREKHLSPALALFVDLCMRAAAGGAAPGPAS